MPEPLVVPTKAHWEQAMTEVDRELLDAFPPPSETERKALVEERAHRLAAADPPPPVESGDLVTLGTAMAESLADITNWAFLGQDVPSAVLVLARDRARAWNAEIEARQERARG